MPNNANRRAREGSSGSYGSKTPDESHSDITLKSIMEKLECIQGSLDSNFAEAMNEINNLRADVNARLSILKSVTDDLRTSLDAAWVEIEAFKQLDEQNKLQIAELVRENAELQAEVSATKERMIKLDNYSRRENIRLLNVPERQEESCKEILCEVMVAVKMEGANRVEFHAVHRIRKSRDDGKPRTIIARFVNRETRNELWYRRKELANSPSHRNVIFVPDYAYETAKEQKKLSNALRNARRMNLAPAYIKNGWIFIQGNSYSANNIPECFQNDEAVPVE